MALQDEWTLELRDISHAAPRGEGSPGGTLHELNVALAPGTFTWLAGPAGGGKELLFRLLSLQEWPSAGTVRLRERLLSPEDLSLARSRNMGLVAATPFLIPTFSLIENIAVPLMKITHPPLEEAETRVADLLRFVGLAEKAECFPAELSALEQARLVLARALANLPLFLFIEDLHPSLSPADALAFTMLVRQAARFYHAGAVALEGPYRYALAEEERWLVADGRVEQAGKRSLHPLS